MLRCDAFRCRFLRDRRAFGARGACVRRSWDGRRALAGVVALVAGWFPGAAAFALDDLACPERRPLPNMRYDEDFRFLADTRCRTEPWDPIKFLPLGRERYASFGGEARIRYERFENPGFGRDPQDRDGYLLQRYLLHGDLHVDDRWRIFGQLESSLIHGRVGGARANDENRLDVNQAFAEWIPYRRDNDAVTLRVGRQEVELGSAQFTSARNGFNDRQSFDGVRAFGEFEGWRFHAMATRVVPTVRGTFDDRSSRDETLSGFFIAHGQSLMPDGQAVFYMSRRTDPRTFYQAGNEREERLTTGTRWWGRGEAWDFNYEVGAQTGSFGSGSIRAWYLSTDTGYTDASHPSRPRYGLRFNIGSGDSRAGDGQLGTFSPLFAATAYSGLAGLIGPSNSVALAPSVTWELDERRTLLLGVIGFWRQSLGDGIYNVNTEVQRLAGSSQARHVGTQPTVQFVWQLTPQLTWLSVLSYLQAGAFLRETPPGEDVLYVTSWLAYRF